MINKEVTELFFSNHIPKHHSINLLISFMFVVLLICNLGDYFLIISDEIILPYELL